MATKDFKVGDKVSRNSAQGNVTGSVKKKLTAPTDIKTHHVAASPDNPQLLVKSAGSGQRAGGGAQAGSLEAGESRVNTDNPRAAVEEFKKAVNMLPKTLTTWLTTKESKAVGFKTTENGESVGHRSGKKIVALLGKTQAEFTSDDIAHARKVVGYIHRHLAQRPAGDIGDTHWRYSLMNWGHDPQESKS